VRREHISGDQKKLLAGSIAFSIAISTAAAVIDPLRYSIFYLILIASVALCLGSAFVAIGTTVYLIRRLVRRGHVSSTAWQLFAGSFAVSIAATFIEPHFPALFMCGVLLGTGLGGIHLGVGVLRGETEFYPAHPTLVGLAVLVASGVALMLGAMVAKVAGLDLDMVSDAIDQHIVD
jgi:hypothetical protein